jgi:hypothetical protein
LKYYMKIEIDCGENVEKQCEKGEI